MDSYLTAADKTKAELAERFPGWRIWYVPHLDRTITWCAQPEPLLNAGSPEHLAEYIAEAHTEAASTHPALANRADYAVNAPGVPQAQPEGPEPMILHSVGGKYS
jgi:hypothetical protein